ncbi:glycosyltransferase family 4 protein [Lachnoclostridium sp. Marseille-P6806]|uniref:glycosyltransferase family 4 protein n=1 Tax=Lachnoclostridium sp. Marseille-P6806 TaxID=2364793 RepID=UPI0010306011|nr:glycosyltransferase family 4 protein [Lachnoclostridium sp. Marseille-P6806]
MGTVLILGNSSAGLYDFRNGLVQALLAEHRVIVSLPDTVKTELLAAEGCEVVLTPINRRGMNPAQDFRLLREYRRLLRTFRPDLVLTYTIKPNVYGGMACAAAGIPYIQTVTGLGSAFQKGGAVRRLVCCLYRAGMRRADCVFFQNEENRETFRRFGLLRGRTRLVSGSGVDLTAHPFAAYPEDAVVRFLFVGRMMREKGIGEYLAAAEALHSETVEFQLLGYCDEDYQSLLDEKERAGVIRQLGFHTGVNRFYHVCSAVVLPTYHEGMSNVLMEASASGRPVIASDISGCREIFEEGRTGFGCRPKSAESLTEALRRFLLLDRERRAEMGRRAREKMEREFDRRRVTAAYMEEAERILRT